MACSLLENPRAFAEKVAGALDGEAVEQATLSGFVSSSFDPFLNHLFATGAVSRDEAAAALAGRPGFVWLDDVEAESGVALMQGMVAELGDGPVAAPQQADLVDVRSRAEVDAWHGGYSAVRGADPRSRDEWSTLHAALGPADDRSLLLLL